MPKTATILADFLPYLMSVTTNAVSDLIADEYRVRYRLKIPEWRVMAVLGDGGAMTQRQLVVATRMDKVAVNRACKVLEDRGLAARSPNLLDGRSHLVDLTREGQAMFHEIMPHALGMERRLFNVLKPAERAQFKATLVRIVDRVRELEAGKPD